MPHGINTAIKQVEVAVPQSPRDRLPTQPQIEQLTTRHNSVLPTGQLRNQPIWMTSPPLYVLGTYWSGLGGGHGTMVLPVASHVCEACKESVAS